MSKSIKVSELVYCELEQIRQKRETFSDVVKRLLDARPQVLEASDILRGVASFGRWEQDREKEKGGL